MFSVSQLFLKDHPLELFTWGSNTNFTLGHRDESTRQVPELLENIQRKGKVCIKEVYIYTPILNKFSSIDKKKFKQYVLQNPNFSNLACLEQSYPPLVKKS